MRRLCLIVLSLPVFLAAQCTAIPTSGPYTGYAGHPATYVISIPPESCFNGDVIMFAHGYVPIGSAPGTWTSQLALPDGTSLPALVNSLGFGFAASSFSRDGLAIVDGIGDTKALADLVRTRPGVRKIFIAGASEGGLIAAKSIENDPSYAGGLAVCGPVGSFQKQLTYFGDVRVLFDYFFPGIIPTAWTQPAIHIPESEMAAWPTIEGNIRRAVNSNVLTTLQLLATAKIPIGLSFSNAADAIAGAIWYNIFATNNAIDVLGGNAYDNIGASYTGSFNDARLNRNVARFHADPTALTNLGPYETNGLLRNPLVTLHTLLDPIIPFEQETLYGAKVAGAGASRELVQIPVLLRYGHCNVTGTQASVALLTLLLKTGL
jgi:hypothetical protein